MGFAVLRLPVLALVKKGIEHSSAELARNFMAGAVRANSLSGLEFAEGRTVDAEPRCSQEGNHAAIEVDFSDVEGCDAAVLARRNLVLMAQLQNLLGDVREAFLGGRGVVVRRRCGGVVRQQAGLLLEVVTSVVGVLRRHAHGERAGCVVTGTEDPRRVSALNPDALAGHL